MVEFVVENGTGLANASSYATVEFSNSYLSESWGTSDQIKQDALIAATEYIDLRWQNSFKGQPKTQTQSLEFPRKNAYYLSGKPILKVPDSVKRATCLYAVAYLEDRLYPENFTTPKQVKRKKTSIGSISTEVEYTDSRTETSWLYFPRADNFMKPHTLSHLRSQVIRN